MALCGEAATVEDLAAKTLVETSKKLENDNESCRLTTCLDSIAMHRHQMHLRRLRTHPTSLTCLPLGMTDEHQTMQDHQWSREVTALGTVLKIIRNREIREALDGLDEKHRNVQLLRLVEGVSVSEIARVTGFLAGTVESSLRHVLNNLRRRKLSLNELNPG